MKYILKKEKNRNKLPIWHNMTQTACLHCTADCRKSAKGREILNILGNKRLYTWAKRSKIYFRRRKKKIGNTIQMRVKGNKIYFSVLDYVSVLFGLPTPLFSLPALLKNGGTPHCQAQHYLIIAHSIYF